MKFVEVLRYELEHRVRSGTTWACAAFMLGWGVVWMLDAGPVDALHANAPFEIASSAGILGLFAVVVTAAIFGDAGVRDVEAGMDPLLFTSPITKLDYLGGRYLAAVIVNAALLLFIPLGFVLCIVLGYPDPAHFGPIRVAAFLEPWLVIQVPNMALMGAVLFAAGVLSRALVPVFFCGIGVFLAFLFSMQDLWVAAGIDALGLGAVEAVSRSWTAAERNTRLIGFPPALLWNRLLWLVVTAGVLVLLHKLVRLAHPDRSGGGERVVVAPEPSAAIPATRARVATSFGRDATAQQILAVARNSLHETVTNLWFVAMVAAFVIASMVLGEKVGGSPFDTSTWPATFLVVRPLDRFIVPVIGALATIFAGELVWKDRDVGAAEIGDAAPVPDAAALGGRFIALLAIIAMFLAAATLGGMLIQVFQGYFDIEPTVYLRVFFGVSFANLALFAVLSMAIHVVVNQKYLSHIVALVAFGFFQFGGSLLPHYLLAYGSDPGWTYTSMNGFGAALGPLAWFTLYWSSWALLLAIAACVLWVRGRESDARHRVRHARTRFTAPLMRASAVGVALIVAVGGFIFYNTDVLDAHAAADDPDARLANYEKQYRRFVDVPQPMVESAKLRIEIYPERLAVDLGGSYRLVNRSSAPIDSIHVFSRPDVEIRSMSFDRGAKPVLEDAEVGYRIFALARSLAPGDSIALSFSVGFHQRDFSTGAIQMDVAKNGTYFERGWLPFVGYQPAFQISNAPTRERFGLERGPPLPGPDVIAARERRYGIRNEDKVRVDAIVGTSADQTAITAGVLRRQWTENDRRYFQYEMEAPQSFTVAVFSGRYAVREDRWHDSTDTGKAVALRVYRHADHDRNLDTFIRSMKSSLDYYSREFGPYGPSVLRIIETIPREGLAARARNNTMILTENNFFQHLKKGQVDQLFFVTAHEIAHQWWGGQIRGAAEVRGSQGFLSETLASYSAVMLVEKEYGVATARRILVFQNDRYYAARGANEVPLLQAESQGYVVYLKGLLAMYLVREYIGADAVNTALRRYVDKHRAGVPPYPTALDVYTELRAVTPDSLQYLLTDLFETVTTWDVRTDSATVEPTGTGEYRVTMDVVARKLRPDTAGKQTEVPMNDLIDIGVFAPGIGASLGEPLYLQQHRIRSGAQRISITVSKQPARAGIDPYRKLLERAARDNVVSPRRELNERRARSGRLAHPVRHGCALRSGQRLDHGGPFRWGNPTPPEPAASRRSGSEDDRIRRDGDRDVARGVAHRLECPGTQLYDAAVRDEPERRVASATGRARRRRYRATPGVRADEPRGVHRARQRGDAPRRPDRDRRGRCEHRRDRRGGWHRPRLRRAVRPASLDRPGAGFLE